MSCTTTTSMYLNISSTICASGSASRSGNTVTISGTLSVSQSGSWNTNAIYGYVDGATTWQKVKNAGNVSSGSANFSFSFTDANAGSRTYTAVFQVWNNAESGGVGGTASTTFSVSWSAGGAAPFNGHIEGIRSYYNPDNSLIEFYADTVIVSTSSALDISQLRILTVPNTGSGLSSQAVTFTNGNSAMVNQYNSVANNGGITISPNTLYYAGIYASNSVGGYWYNGPSIPSPCYPATIYAEMTSDTTATVSYETTADGGYYTKYIEYSLDGGENWFIGATISSGSASAGTFTISDLSSQKNYTVPFRVRTKAGSTACATVSFPIISYTMYGPVNNLTKTIKKQYGPVNSQTKQIKRIYKSVDGRAKLIYKEKRKCLI